MMEVFGKMIKKFVNDDIVFFDYEEGDCREDQEGTGKEEFSYREY